ncbi:uncharacterized protein LOC131226654 isoform X2 [Magnolia sinica]|uniref:uncharacterized protein LOC131226654 isoform X2 n=1 Tax=Magnolia sinica TaxID=86752 RepID=UPI002659EF6F|nr:uncharacterized protein LOC131226654 isoform X2 [Magnolia sinica]
MEEVFIDVETDGGDHVYETSLGKISSSESSSTDADPVVYKLVRVEGDGRLVPATDDEVMEVEDSLEDDKIEPPLVKDPAHTEGYISNDGFSSKTADFESLEGLSKSENTEGSGRKLNARLEYIGEMLQKVKQEERLRLSCESPDHSSKYMNIDGRSSDQQEQLPSSDEKLPAENALRETILPTSRRLISDDATELASSMTCPKPTDEPISCKSVSDTGTSSIPDFSTIKGEIICLDNLSIRELHETFRATFGRETSAKDKLWLKRRIAMGLTNSCDVSTTNFIIKGKTLVPEKAKEESHCGMDGNKCSDDSQLSDQTIRGIYDDDGGPATFLTNQMEDQHVSSGKRFREPKTDSDTKSEDLHMEQSTAKRVRKPTRRYIEELSEVETRECSGRLISSVKCLEHGQSSPKSRIRLVQDVGLARTAFVTRQDSLGGCGVQIPYVSRVRRGRPRENFRALMNYHDMADNLVEKAFDVCASRQDDDGESGSKIMKHTDLPQQDLPLIVAEAEREGEAMVTCAGEQQQEHEPARLDSSGDNSDDNVATVPTSKGGTRRKHHRAWTINEVMKLVDGVSRYGAGRWSEIKRLAFASYTYRTSVDLKDKWRNLLRASFSQAPAAKGVGGSRKHASMPIPMPILIRVRELAEMHSQVTSEQSSGKLAGCSGRTVHETRDRDWKEITTGKCEAFI